MSNQLAVTAGMIASSSISAADITGNSLTIGTSTVNDCGQGATITSNSGNRLTVSNQSFYSSQMNGYYQSSDNTWHDPYQQSPWTIPPTIYPGDAIGPYNTPAPNPIL